MAGPHARSHSGPVPFRRVQLRRVGEDVQGSPMPGHTRAQCTLGKMSRSPLPSQRHMHSAPNRHPHYCRHPRRCRLQRPRCDVQVLQPKLLGNASSPTPRHIQVLEQELLSLCCDEQTSALLRASTYLGGKSRSGTLGKYRFSNKNSAPSARREGGTCPPLQQQH